MKVLTTFLLLLSCCIIQLQAQSGNDNQSKLSRVVEQTHETSIYARVKVSNGLVYISKSDDNRPFSGDFFFTEQPPKVAYEVVGDEGRLAVKFNNSSDKNKNRDYDEDDDINIELGEIYDNECHLRFSNQLPLRLKMDLGVIRGNIDLGGLRIEKCQIKSAVSEKTVIDFGGPNVQAMELLEIENGVGKLKLMNLCNANFSEFTFEAGVGSYFLDFGGELQGNARADLEIGMGKLEINIPRKMGVRISVDKSFFSSFDIDEVYKKNDVYYNDNWKDAKNRLDIAVDCGIAKVVVNWTDD